MKRLRFFVTVLITWLFIFFNVERFSRSINFTDVAYFFVPTSAIITILVTRSRKVSLWAILGGAIPLFLILKYWLKSGDLGNSLPLTVTEVCFIAVTILLARWLSYGIGEFEHVIANITFAQTGASVNSFSVEQAEMYRELNRARSHQRPLSILSIGINKHSVQVALDQLVKEAQQAMMQEYAMSNVAQALCDKLEDYNIVARNHDHFIILLPEVRLEQLDELSYQLWSAVSEQAGIALRIGAASFPKDGTTFERLVDRAVERMEQVDDSVVEESAKQPQSLKVE
jgi:GGDEF domain-containing protein